MGREAAGPGRLGDQAARFEHGCEARVSDQQLEEVTLIFARHQLSTISPMSAREQGYLRLGCSSAQACSHGTRCCQCFRCSLTAECPPLASWWSVCLFPFEEYYKHATRILAHLSILIPFYS